jgi:thiamine-phosphate pyrophosphorylase
MLIPDDTLRIIDANLNRIGEGLRFLEELARLRLDDAALTQQLKDMRHDVAMVGLPLKQSLLGARDVGGDVGVDMEVAGEAKGRGIAEAIVANARRAQESLRVMEELAKAPELNLDTERYKKARFDLYTIEKTVFARVLRRDRAGRISGLYVIVDTALLKGRSCEDVAGEAVRGGAKVIQLRDKGLGKKELLPLAQGLRDLCAEHDVLFMVNDYLDVALAVGADGLHVGQDDLPVRVARRLLPQDKLLGCSARTVERAKAAQADGADYVAVGAMYQTATKDGAEVVGPERLRQVVAAVDVPVVAIGGINKDNVGRVMEAGAAAVAVISAVLGAEDVAGATRQIVKAIEGESHG